MTYSQASKNDFFSSGKFWNQSMMINYRFNFFQLIERRFVPLGLPFVRNVFVNKRFKIVKRDFKISHV